MENKSSDLNIRILYICAFTSSLGALAFGYNLTVFNALRVFIKTNLFPEAAEFEITVLASLPTLLGSIGSLVAGRLVNTRGRRATLMINDCIGIVGSCLCMFQILPVMIIGRALQGFTMGVNTVGIPLFNIEMADKRVKGKIGGIYIIMLSLGLMIGLGTELFVPKDPETAAHSQIWRPIIGLANLFYIARLSIFAFYINYETPLYLALNDKIDDVRKVLRKLYIGEENVEKQVERVLKDKEAVTTVGNATFADMFRPKYRKAFFVSLFFCSGVQLSGFSPIFMYFNVFAIESCGGDAHVASIYATVMGFISFFTVILSTIVIDKAGRRPFITYGMLLVTLTEFAYTGIAWINGLDDPSLKYLLMLWPFFYRLSVGALGFTYCAEVLPGVGVSFCLFWNWFLAFFVIQAFMPLVNWIGVAKTMGLFSIYCLALTIICFLYIVETKGRTKASILGLFRGDYRQTMQAINSEKTDVEKSLLPEHAKSATP